MAASDFIVPKPRGRVHYRKSVFDAGRTGSLTEAVAAGLQVTGFTGFRRTERDRQPPRRVLTAKLLGDPAPDRKVPEIPPETGSGVVEPPKPIFLTFREMRAYYAAQDSSET